MDLWRRVMEHLYGEGRAGELEEQDEDEGADGAIVPTLEPIPPLRQPAQQEWTGVDKLVVRRLPQGAVEQASVACKGN